MSNLTPDLQFMVSPNPPRQGLIRNEDHYAFLNLTQGRTIREPYQRFFSYSCFCFCFFYVESESSGKNQVSVKVTQIIDALRDEDSSSDESEIDIVIDDKSSKSQSEIIRRDGDVGAADCHPQVYSGNLSDTPISGEGSSSSEINTSLHSGNDSSTIPSSPTPSLQSMFTVSQFHLVSIWTTYVLLSLQMNLDQQKFPAQTYFYLIFQITTMVLLLLLLCCYS